MSIRKLGSEGGITVTAEHVLLDVCKADGGEDLGQVTAAMRIHFAGVEEGEGGGDEVG